MLPAVQLSAAACGFFGKLPARGDFVRSGLPSSFINPWDDWMSRMLAAAQTSLGAGWRDAWMEAPIWRFALDPGVCGPDGAVGLWMPSIDRAGRLYPLTLAALSAAGSARALAACAGAFLDAAERAGLDALEHDLAPEPLADRITGAADLAATPDIGGAALIGASLWWTQGSPLVPSTAFAGAALPGENQFTRMLDAGGTEMVA